MMTFLLGTVLPVGLMAAVVLPALRQVRGPTHPSRLLAEVLTAGFVLLVCALLVSMPGWVQLLWWATLLLVAAGVVVTTRRSLRALPAPPAAAAPAGPATAVPAAPATGRSGPVGRGELIGNGVLWGATILAAVVGG